MSEEEGIKPEEIIAFLRDYIMILKDFVSKWKELYQKYPEVFNLIADREKFATTIQRLRDEDAGKILKAVIAVSNVATVLAGAGEINLESINKIERELDRLVESL